MPRKIKKTNLRNSQLDLFDNKHNKQIIEKAKAHIELKAKIKAHIESREKAQKRLDQILKKYEQKIIEFSKKSISIQQDILTKNLYNYIIEKKIKSSYLEKTPISKAVIEVKRALFNLKAAKDLYKSESKGLNNYKKSKYQNFISLKEYENDVISSEMGVLRASDIYLKKLTKLIIDFRKDGVIFKYD